jgi:hypothetical protein
LIEKYLEAADRALAAALPEVESVPESDLLRWLGGIVRLRWRRSEEALRRAAIRDRIMIAEPNRRLVPREAAGRILSHFARRAWRRPARGEEVDRLLTLFDRAWNRGDGFEASVKLPLKAVLVSPHFLFLVEPDPGVEGIYRLDDYQIASRLSYFLWSTMPDQELFALAEADLLDEPDLLRAQVRRMLAHPKARALGEEFACQWLGIEALGEIVRPDPERFPEFNDVLAGAMREETILLFSEIVRNDRSLVELLDADYTFVNQTLAGIYGIEGIEGETMRRIELADANRGGVLGLGSILTVTSHPLRTSPVLRGKWVLEQLLGDQVPPPPPEAGTLPQDDIQPDGLTFRQRLEAHRRNPDCASCHQKMDPIGFGLESFDPIGRWRVEQNGGPIDSTGALPSGESFGSPAELKMILRGKKDQFIEHLTRKMLGYALGRALNPYDRCVIEETVQALKGSDYRASVLFEQIVLSYPFLHRYSKR